MKLPIRSTSSPRISTKQLANARNLARRILFENPHLNPEHGQFKDYAVVDDISDDPCLHIDDFSEIPVIGDSDNSRVLQQRARLRAVDGDWVVQSRTVEQGYSDYCEYRLGLGRVHWLYPAARANDTRQIAVQCWQDRRLRHDLEYAIRHKNLRYIHPHISTFNVWELAALLHSSTRMPISVIGPRPKLASWVNDKVEFTRLVERSLGEDFVPQTESAFNFASLAKKVARLALSNERIAIKFPYGTGGHGNFLFDASQLRGLGLKKVRSLLHQRLGKLRWPKKGRLLIDVWETKVLCSPSVQIWIPPTAIGMPIIEGVFIQDVGGEQCEFLGSRPSDLPESIEQQIVDLSFQLAIVLQQLGYVGRCSYDLILTGNSPNDGNLEFIECNARWGGTSAPMTLMNRLGFHDFKDYCIRRIIIPGLSRVKFTEIQRELSDSLYHPGTGRGFAIVFNPARIQEDSAIEVVAILNAMEADQSVLVERLSRELKSLVSKRVGAISNSITGFLLDHAEFDETRNQT